MSEPAENRSECSPGEDTHRGPSYRTYTDEDRARATVLFFANGKNLRRTARELGIPVTTLRMWVKDGSRPAPPQRVLEVGAALDAKLEAWLDGLLAIHPSEFPRDSFLEHVEAIAVLADRLIALRSGCKPVADQLADARPVHERPLDLSGQVRPGRPPPGSPADVETPQESRPKWV